MARISRQQLEAYLWSAATLLRGTIDAGDYEQFIFPLLFFKRLCDVFDQLHTIPARAGEMRAAVGPPEGRRASLLECSHEDLPDRARREDRRSR